MNTPKRTDLSIMRIAATLCVVLLHTCSALSDNTALYAISAGQLQCYETLKNLTSGMLPLFFMMTGVLLLRRDKPLAARDCVLKYARRIAIALFLFGVPFSMLIQIAAQKRLALSFVAQGFADVLTGNSFAHLWYLYALLGVYLILPLLKAYTDTATHAQQRYVLLVLGLFNLALPFLSTLTGITTAFELPIASFPVFYVLLGKYLDDSDFRPGKRSLTAALLAVLAAVALLCARPAGRSLLGYSSPIIALESALLFLLFKGTAVRGEQRCQGLWAMDRLCFGVYLIHPVFINVAYRMLGLTPDRFGVGWPAALGALWLVFTALSFAGSWVMAKVPGMRKYVL